MSYNNSNAKSRANSRKSMNKMPVEDLNNSTTQSQLLTNFIQNPAVQTTKNSRKKFIIETAAAN